MGIFTDLFEKLEKPFLQNNKNDKRSILTSNDLPRDKVEVNISSLDDSNLLGSGFFEYSDANQNFLTGNLLKKSEELQRNERQTRMIKEFRKTSMVPEVSQAIDEIMTEIINVNDIIGYNNTVDLDFKESIEISNGVKKLFQEEFQEVYNILNFDSTGESLLRRWYIDGVIYIHLSYLEKDIKKESEKFKY